jgi:glycosyltransferase involved in cell wall biosynthesis
VLFVETGYFIGRHLWRVLRGSDRRSLLARLFSAEEVEHRIKVRKALNVLPWGFTYRLANTFNWLLTARVLRRSARSLPEPVVLWIYDPSAAEAIASCGETLAVYDCVDDYVEQAASPRKRSFVAAADRLAVERSRLVFASSRTMYERQRRLNPATHLVRNAGDYEHFKQAADRSILAPEIAGLASPIVGFAGNFLASKVDLELLEKVALARPQWTLLLIGPAPVETARELDTVVQLPNVHWLGQKPYADLPRYVAGFDVGLIPYVSNAYTKSCFPLKLYEYLAAGKPVVATGLPELSGMEPDVMLVDGAAAVVEAVEQALERANGGDESRRIDLASRNTWETRTERLLQLIDDEL